MNGRTVVLAVASLGLVGGCAGPSAADRRAQAETAQRLMSAAAVHMPPGGVDSCVGVTVRLAGADAEAERAVTAQVFTPAEVAAATATSAWSCASGYVDALAEAGLSPEPMQVDLAYGVDPAGKVCAVVQLARPDPVDPAAGPLQDDAALCARDHLFSASFPAQRLDGKDRAVLRFRAALGAEPPKE